MENLADRPFRRALASTVGGFDEACTEFMRVPGATSNPMGSIRGVTGWYDAAELAAAALALDGRGGAPVGSSGGPAGGGSGIPLGAQVMGSSPELMGLAAQYLAEVKRAPRIDLNCGCPANTVTGNGAGSSLLRTPQRIHDIVSAMVAGVRASAAPHTPVSVKLRAGFDDTSLFEDNLLAAQEAGASFITLHPRTKRQCYDGAADWSLTARAVQLLRVPVIGNGDVVCVERAHALLRQTGCHGVMVGRGAVQDPLLFHRIRHSFVAGQELGAGLELGARGAGGGGGGAAGGGGGGGGVAGWREPELMQSFLRYYAAQFIPELRPQEQQQGPGEATSAAAAAAVAAAAAAVEQPVSVEYRASKFGRLKKVMKYLFASSPQLAVACESLLRVRPDSCTPADMVDMLCEQIGRHWPASGPTRLVLYDHMNKNSTELQHIRRAAGTAGADVAGPGAEAAGAGAGAEAAGAGAGVEAAGAGAGVEAAGAGAGVEAAGAGEGVEAAGAGAGVEVEVGAGVEAAGAGAGVEVGVGAAERVPALAGVASR
ncbi:hypothetical protein CHLRE_06g284800v5 [Chlamydomonas reinhardtii]|uniref:tRNA-dihydrouridine(47) synthase [NAD(P)(+)] n=1 Tax=Chlamydomonas reinhardtii TaxID=3055 RepID=A0A2K3DPX7_CHLRE|nr:uncharacterized protein CHLRE_06g284800v5 [Chlamydomonas reinhardtii]PNW82580.1 hypothetical protein CHLRE_06g284800v5 [Chlamydomonas reinhardtii]